MCFYFLLIVSVVLIFYGEIMKITEQCIFHFNVNTLGHFKSRVKSLVHILMFSHFAQHLINVQLVGRKCNYL